MKDFVTCGRLRVRCMSLRASRPLHVPGRGPRKKIGRDFVCDSSWKDKL